MAIEYLDGIRLYRSLSIGLKRVVSRQDYLNRINVFPVPDCDTGTNMAYTLTSIEDGIANNIHSNIRKMSASIADAALDGARGNSGAILAQFFVGFSEGIINKKELRTTDFGHALSTAKEYAYDALAVPREGTILSVISDWVDDIKVNSKYNKDFRSLLRESLNEAQKSLDRTPEQLDVLAKAGVVDAGAQGFVDLMNGIQEFIDNGSITDIKNIELSEAPAQSNADLDESYRFCTECTVIGDNIDRIAMRENLMEHGKSIVLAGTKKKAKVHIHTNEPKTIMEICGRFGKVSGEKADDMLHQQKDAYKDHKSIALVVDSGCDLPEEMIEELDIHVVPVRLNFGDKHYVDKITMTADEFWEEIDRNPKHPKTSQPSPGDFRRQYQFLASHYESAVSLHLPAISSGTFQSAVTATKSLHDFPVKVLDACNGSIGTGLIAWRVADAINEGHSYDEVVEIAEQAIINTKIFITLDTLDFAVKGGRVTPITQTIANLLRINPILALGKDGIVSVGKTFGRSNKYDKFLKYLMKNLPEKKPFRVGIGHVKNKDKAHEFRKVFVDLVGNENVFVSDVGPALCVHAGRNAMVVAFNC